MTAIPHPSRGRRLQRGLSMTEVLVSVIVLSVGLLGLASMNLTGLRQSQSANSLSVATQLAEEMAERVRANLVGVKNNVYTKICVCNGSCGSPSRCLPGTAAVTACPTVRTCYGADCSGTSKTGTSIGGADVTDWHDKVCTLLPRDAAASVTCTAPCTDAQHLIQIAWDDVTQQEDGAGKRQAVAEVKTLRLAFTPVDPRR